MVFYFCLKLMNLCHQRKHLFRNIKKKRKKCSSKLHCNNVFKNISWNTQKVTAFQSAEQLPKEDTGQTRDVCDITNNKPTPLFAGEAREQHSKGSLV